MKSWKARVVTQKPGGTDTPARVRAPRFAPLPPTIDVSFARTSAKNRVSGRSPLASAVLTDPAMDQLNIGARRFSPRFDFSWKAASISDLRPGNATVLTQ